MKISGLLNKKIFTIIFLFLFNSTFLYSEEVIDIWNTDNIEQKKNSINNTTEDSNVLNSSIYDSQIKSSEPTIVQQEISLKNKIEVAGIYDPFDNDLSIDMWSNSDEKKIISQIQKINKINLSKDAKYIFNITILTNSYLPKKNSNKVEFLKLKSEWLISQKNFELIEKYLVMNSNLNTNSELIRFYLDEYLSYGDVNGACDLFNKSISEIKNNYLLKFKIYCFVNNGKLEEAQLYLDLLKEKNFKDEFFEKRLGHLMGYEEILKGNISENSLLDFHLSHITNPDFKYEPDNQTSKNIWRYLSSFNLLASVDNVDLEDMEKMLIIEKGTNDGNYAEKDLFNLYKRFMFSINQLLSTEDTYKLFNNFELRALLYQKILISENIENKFRLLSDLKNLFIKDNLSNAFNKELRIILNEINETDVPEKFKGFYNFYINLEEEKVTKIKFDNKTIHQSKLLKYFIDDKYNKKNIEKDLASILKKIKKNKKYFVSIKDIILLESLKYDGIKIPKKFSNIYKLNEQTLPEDIQILIMNDEMGLVMLRLIEIIGEDNIEDLGPETLYFIVNALNQLNIDKIRNYIFRKVLPLKI